MGDVMNIVLMQTSPIWEDPAASLKACSHALSGAFSGQLPAVPDIVVFPEFFAAGFTMNPELAEPEDCSPTLEWMKVNASGYGCAIAGSVPVADRDGHRYNRLYFVTPGKEVYSYDKSHLFFGGEDVNYTAGSGREVFEYRGWRIMPGICFDLRFPEWSRNSPDCPYDLYLNVANWPVARTAAADVLLKARSIENVCWSVFCNRTGRDELLEYAGNSAVIDYRGRSRGKTVEVDGVSMVTASMDREPMYRFRSGFPVLDRMV